MDLSKGIRTSEFWLSAAAMLLGAILSSGVVGNDNWIRLLGAIQAILAQLGYTWSRSQVKKAASAGKTL